MVGRPISDMVWPPHNLKPLALRAAIPPHAGISGAV
jgi:hypothetical protein